MGELWMFCTARMASSARREILSSEEALHAAFSLCEKASKLAFSIPCYDERLNLGRISFRNVLALGHRRLPRAQSRQNANIGQVEKSDWIHFVTPRHRRDTSFLYYFGA